MSSITVQRLTFEFKHAEYLENGLATLHPSTLYKGYKAKLAARETARQRLVVTAWEIEESEHFTAFLDALHAENEDQLGLADKELQRFRSFFSEHDRLQVDDDRDYLQAIYEDECEILRVTSAQAEQISKILGSRVKDAFLQSGAAESRPHSLEIPDDEDDRIILDSSEDLDSEEECPGVGAGEASHQPHALPIVNATRIFICTLDPSYSLNRGSSKIAIPKPARGSGLNPSHFPANTQMDLSNEQPEEPASNAFNPHSYYSNYTDPSFSTHSGFAPFNYNDDTRAGPSSSAQDDPSSSAGLGSSSSANLHYSNYTDPSFSAHSDHAPFNYNDDARTGPSSSAQGDPSSSAGLGSSSSANLHYGNYTNPSFSAHSDHAPFNYNDDTRTGPSSSAGLGSSSSANLHTHSGHAPFNYDNNARSGPSSSAGLGPSSSTNLHHTPFNYDDNAHAGPSSSANYSLPNYHPDELSALDDMSGIAPNPHHIQVLYSSTEAEPSLGPQHNPPPITMGEIPVSQVIHTTGPARSSDRRRCARKLPGTPYLTRQDSDVQANIAATTEANITVVQATSGAPDNNRYFMVTGAVRDQIFQRAKELAMGVIFTKDAMATSTDDKNLIVKSLLRQATPKFPGLSGTPRWSNQSKDVTKIWRKVIVVRTVLMTFTRDGIVVAYDLFPPQGSQISPEAFRVTRVGCLVRDNSFMHKYSFNVDGTLTIHAKFKNPFILFLITKLIWNTRFRLDNLLTSPHEQLRYMMGLAGTFTKCALMEQGREVLSATRRLSPEANSSTFDGICSEMDDLSIEEQADLDEWIDHIVVCGVSQQRIKVELSDFNLDSD
ncbi:hypothetical protein F4604DRAFT_1687609 [Suillus subluteus]|nr:hypothetical protein F4604DRAFT_1687609 [Suillus subluteus]